MPTFLWSNLPQSASLTAPWGIGRPLVALGSGVPAASICVADFADAEAAVLKHLVIELQILVNDGKHVDQMHIFLLRQFRAPKYNSHSSE